MDFWFTCKIHFLVVHHRIQRASYLLFGFCYHLQESPPGKTPSSAKPMASNREQTKGEGSVSCDVCQQKDFTGKQKLLTA